VLGGHGYIKDYGIEQFVRNARVGQLYEGANGIQATDLVHRKLLSHAGRPWKHFARAISDFIESHADDAELKTYTVPLDDGLQCLSKSIAWLNTDGCANYGHADAASYDVLTAMGILYVGWTWSEIAATVLDSAKCRYIDETTRATKLALAKTWMQRQMPLLEAICRRIECGNDSLLSMPDDWI
jgi:hypothetical protein